MIILSSSNSHKQRIHRFLAPRSICQVLDTLESFKLCQQSGYLNVQCLLYISSVYTRFQKLTCLQLKLPFLTLSHRIQSRSNFLSPPLFPILVKSTFFIPKLLKAESEHQSLPSLIIFCGGNISIGLKNPKESKGIIWKIFLLSLLHFIELPPQFKNNFIIDF